MAKKVNKSRKSLKTKECPICNGVYKARGLHAHMALAHSTKMIDKKPKVEMPGINAGSESLVKLNNEISEGINSKQNQKKILNKQELVAVDRKMEHVFMEDRIAKMIGDNVRLPLLIEPRLPNYHIDKVSLDVAFMEMEDDLNEEDLNKLSQKAASMLLFLKSPERVRTIVADIVEHFKAHVEPDGLKAMIVTHDRFACIQYKEELDKILGTDASEVVICSFANDEFDFKQKWEMDNDKLHKMLKKFNDAESPLKFLIVSTKLLTGFDSPIIQTIYLDKSVKNAAHLKAICIRTKRLFLNKTFGRIVDYFGVFDDTIGK